MHSKIKTNWFTKSKALPLFLLFVGFTIFSPALLAQNNTVSGTVKDDSGVPLTGVNVIQKGTSNGVVTDQQGQFKIVLPSRNAKLVFSFVGFANQEVSVGDKPTVNITLVTEAQILGDVVVLGYGSQRKKLVTLDHQLKNRLDKYPVIIIPEFTGLKDDLKKLVLDYVQNGGNLIVIGAKGVKEFEPQMGVTYEDYQENKVISMGFENQISSAKTNVQHVKPLTGTKVIGELYNTDDFRFPSGYPVATVASYGKGKIAGFYIDAAKVYYTYQARGYLKIMNAVIDEVFPKPVVRLSGSDCVHAVVSQKDDKWFVNLINAAGSHFNAKVYQYDHIPATGDLTLELNTPKPIKKIVLQPDGKILKFSKKDGRTSVVVPSVAVHSIVQIEF